MKNNYTYNLSIFIIDTYNNLLKKNLLIIFYHFTGNQKFISLKNPTARFMLYRALFFWIINQSLLPAPCSAKEPRHEIENLPRPDPPPYNNHRHTHPPVRNKIYSENNLNITNGKNSLSPSNPTSTSPLRLPWLPNPPPSTHLRSHPNSPPNPSISPKTPWPHRPFPLPPKLPLRPLHFPHSQRSLRDSKISELPVSRSQVLPLLPIPFP